MRYLTAITTARVASQLERAIGFARLQPLRPGDRPDRFGGERFAGILVDDASAVTSAQFRLPVILLAPWHRAGLQQFRTMAEAGIDVRLWADWATTVSETTLRGLSGPRAPDPSAAILSYLRDRHSGLAADIMTAAAVLSNGRRSMDEVARVCDTSPSGVRGALRDSQLPAISGLLARMRALHALWAWESERPNFWSSAGFRTLAELSAHLSQHTGAPLGRWKVPGGFSALLQSIAVGLHAETMQEVAVG